MDLTGIGIWSSQLRYGDPAESADAAAELDELGFRALWIPDVGGAVFDAVGNLLAATKQTTVATGILNLWMHTPSDVAASYAELTAAHGDRFLLGIGVSHAPLIDAGAPGRYRKPLAATASFLDELDATPQPVPAERRVLAALGPKMLSLSARRGRRGTPLPRHPRAHRSGPWDSGRRTLAAARADRDSHRQRRRSTRYRNRLAAFVFGVAELRQQSAALRLLRRRSGTGEPDRLFDAIIAWGDEEAILRRVSEHRSAGADHVCIQVLLSDPNAYPREQWRRIAAALT